MEQLAIPTSVTVKGNFQRGDLGATLVATYRIGVALQQYVPDLSPQETFSKVFPFLSIQTSTSLPKGLGAFTQPNGDIDFFPGQLNSKLLIHEIGHVIDISIPYEVRPSTLLYREGVKDEDGRLVTGPLGRLYNRNCGLRSPFNGYQSDDWHKRFQIHPRRMDEAKDIISPANEDWADIWLNFVRRTFVDNKAGRALYRWTDEHMVIWVPILLARK